MITLGDAIRGQTASVARSLVDALLRACDPRPRVASALRRDPIPTKTPLHVLAFGKASIAMTLGVLDAHPEREVRGVVLAPPELARDATIPPPIRVLAADHPLPTPRNVDASHALANHAATIPNDHTCVVCISGGGSAHLCLPGPGVSLEEIIETTRSLNARGAPIAELNAARTRLEPIKGGGLARLLGRVRTIRVLLVSDVVGNDPRVIASGPMMGEDPPAHRVVLSNNDAIEEAARLIRAHTGTEPLRIGAQTGPSIGAGRALADLLIQGAPSLVMGGETTVHAEDAQGSGGPVTETIVSAASELLHAHDTRWSIVGFATDGIDGPTDAAGGALSGSMRPDPDRLGRALALHDTLGLLDRIDASIRTGPTGTNVNDIVALWRPGPESGA